MIMKMMMMMIMMMMMTIMMMMMTMMMMILIQVSITMKMTKMMKRMMKRRKEKKTTTIKAINKSWLNEMLINNHNYRRSIHKRWVKERKFNIIMLKDHSQKLKCWNISQVTDSLPSYQIIIASINIYATKNIIR